MQRKLLFLACFFICAYCFAQQYPFVYYTPKDGLVNSRVRGIKQDSKGRMYFITYGGLSVYDGTGFTSYSQQEGLANELVNDMLEIAPDSFLISTNTQKLNTLIDGRIGEYKTADRFYPVINRFLKSSDGLIYAAADDGLYVLKDRRFLRLPLADDKGKDIGFYLDHIVEWRHFFLITPWTGDQKEKLILYDRLAKKVRDVYTGERVVSTAVDTKGRIWMTTPKGINLLDTSWLEKGRIKLKALPSEFAKISGLKNVNAYFDRTGTAWFYCGTYAIKFSSSSGLQMISASQGLKVSNLLDLFRDREGTIWMACDGNGIIKMRNTNIQLVQEFLPGRPALITAAQQGGDTAWLFNSVDNTIYRLFKNEIRSFGLPGKKIKANNIYIQGRQLYLCSNKELICIGDKDKTEAYERPKAILKDPSRNLAFGNGISDSYGAIILQLRRNDTGFCLSVIKGDKIIMERKIPVMADQMAFDREGKLWVVSRDNHIMVFSLHPDQPSRYLELLKDYSKELPAMDPRSIAIDQSGQVWIGTRYNGIYQLSLDGGDRISAVQYTTHNGLTDNFAYTLTSGDNNTVWVGTQTGLDKVFLKKGKYIIGNISKNNNFFQAVYRIITPKDGTVWVLTNEGSVIKILPSANAIPAPPPLLLTSFQINNNPCKDSTGRFSYKKNNFTFHFAAPSYIDESSIQYSYRLEGSGNDSWSPPSNNSLFNFINLAPGHYTLSVRADFPEALYDTQTFKYPFTIMPPWWKTWWFLLALAISVATLMFLFVREYYRQKLEKQKNFLEKRQAVEKERTRIATDMHDDLGSGLSRIKFLSETIGIKKQKHDPIEEDIAKIREYSHEMIDKMGEIVWALNERNDSLSDLLSYTRSYAVEYLEQSGIACTMDVPEVFPSDFVNGEFRRNVFLSVKETLHNIVKHAQASHVYLTIRIGKKLTIIIRDDGVGFDPRKIRPYSNGLPNIRQRMKEIGGLLEIDHTNGTTIGLMAPL
jgi:signal transduction histidine kinase/ligand-binding sensor domain-containing protein